VAAHPGGAPAPPHLKEGAGRARSRRRARPSAPRTRQSAPSGSLSVARGNSSVHHSDPGGGIPGDADRVARRLDPVRRALWKVLQRPAVTGSLLFVAAVQPFSRLIFWLAVKGPGRVRHCFLPFLVMGPASLLVFLASVAFHVTVPLLTSSVRQRRYLRQLFLTEMFCLSMTLVLAAIQFFTQVSRVRGRGGGTRWSGGRARTQRRRRVGCVPRLAPEAGAGGGRQSPRTQVARRAVPLRACPPPPAPAPPPAAPSRARSRRAPRPTGCQRACRTRTASR